MGVRVTNSRCKTELGVGLARLRRLVHEIVDLVVNHFVHVDIQLRERIQVACGLQ